MTGIDPAEQANVNSSPTGQGSASSESSKEPIEKNLANQEPGSADLGPENESESEAAASRRILIGSQRDPVAYRARKQRDWTPIESAESDPAKQTPASPPAAAAVPVTTPPASSETVKPAAAGQEQRAELPVSTAASAARTISGQEQSSAEDLPPVSAAPRPPIGSVMPAEDVLMPPVIVRQMAGDEPGVSTSGLLNRRRKLSADMEDDLVKALGDASFDDLMSGNDAVSKQSILEPESRHRGRVASVRRDVIFIELGGREQGCVPFAQFAEPPNVGDMIEVVVHRFNAEEGLYDLAMPDVSIDVGNWDDVQDGMLVEVQVVGHNTGGLECEVNHLRGFIPASQISLYRVEDLAQFVGQRFTCVITEANPSRQNLVLSRRAVLEREKEENQKKFFDALQPGQIYEGIVRKLMDFGAFVDLGGGVDGLLHVSQLAWSRVNHPSEILKEGQPIRVKVEKVDRATGRISLAYRDMLENPWTNAARKYPSNSHATGKVTKLMEFGAFVELEPGVEGLVHISELSHKRVWRTSDVVKEGQEVEVLVLNVNAETQRMSLSIKALSRPEPTKKEKEDAAEAEAAPIKKKGSSNPNQPLRGGLGKATGGENVGLNW